MRCANDPRQNRLFDVFGEILSPLAYKELPAGWQHLFRQTILERMPVGTVEEHFDPAIGQPTKELYSMCGLIEKSDVDISWFPSKARERGDK